MPDKLRFRQIHLDFHTSEYIDKIGESFDADVYTKRLKHAHVDSVTTFAKCHHGYAYYDTNVGVKHPHLASNLLKNQFKACKSADINVPIYLSVCWDEHYAFAHSDCRQILPDGTFFTFLGKNLEACWSYLCLNSPYIDYLVKQISEVVTFFPEADGIWLDIVNQQQCCCQYCRKDMQEQGLDWTNEADRITFSQSVLFHYYRKTYDAVKSIQPDMPVFHNQGHIPRGDRDRFAFYDHLEIESLPTGGWGYDHFPVSAKYVEGLGREYLGMTGRFHIVWGEFGGYKHPNALRYECAAMLALGAKCSIGDQLHPDGELDKTTYDIIGTAYNEVREKEAWCTNTNNIADIALLSCQAVNAAGATGERGKASPEDDGAARILLEGHFLFDVIDPLSEFESYRLIVLPDMVRLNETLAVKLQCYIDQGGKVLCTGLSGLKQEEMTFAIDVGAELIGETPFKPDFLLPNPPYRSEFCDAAFVMRGGSMQIELTSGVAPGEVFLPYFERSARQFCGHQHAPIDKSKPTLPCGSIGEWGAYLTHPVFSEYYELGAVVLKSYVLKIIHRLLDNSPTISVIGLPSSGRVTMREQTNENRYIIHLLYATPSLRGKTILGNLEVVEDLPILSNVSITLRTSKTVKSARLQPQNRELDFSQTNRRVNLIVDAFSCHQMLEIKYV